MVIIHMQASGNLVLCTVLLCSVLNLPPLVSFLFTAIEQLKAMITQKALLGISSPTTDGAESLRQTSFMNSASPNDIYLSPVDGKVCNF